MTKGKWYLLTACAVWVIAASCAMGCSFINPYYRSRPLVKGDDFGWGIPVYVDSRGFGRLGFIEGEKYEYTSLLTYLDKGGYVRWKGIKTERIQPESKD